jgi:5'-nucleotidase
MPDPAKRSRRILVTNDDGINATGIKTLEEIARTLSDDVWVVAPEVNQSGAAHSLTLHRPLRLRRLDERHVAVDGTPTDCVLLALQHIITDTPVDLVLSGINHGGNLGEDVTYSGTVAAAMEATLFKVPAVALSQVAADRKKVRWDTAEQHAPSLLRNLLKTGWPADVLININLPDVPPEEVRGWQVAAQGTRKIGDTLVERIDPRGEPYIWIGALRESTGPGEGTDLASIAAGCISVTPVHLDMTHRPSLELLRQALATTETPRCQPLAGADPLPAGSTPR